MADFSPANVILSLWRRRIRLIQLGILVTFGLIPVWYRLPQPPIFAQLYVTHFLILLPMLWSIGWWLISGLPGLTTFRSWRSYWALALLLLALWGFASELWAFMRLTHPEVGQTAALQLGVSALFAVVVACAAPSPRVIVAVLATSLIWNGAITIAQALHQGSLGLTLLGEFPFDPQSSGASILESGSLRWVRPYGLLPHPNMLAGTLLVGVLAAAAWILGIRRWQRSAGIGLFIFGLMALLLSFSRAAWGGLVVGLLAVAPFTRTFLRRREMRISLGIAAALALLVGIGFVIAYWPLLAARAGEGQVSIELRSVSDRLVFMDFAVRSISERPILGVGIGNFPWRTSYYLADTFYDLRGDNVHHVLLAAAAELGIVGLALLIAAILCGLIGAFQGMRRAEGDDRAARMALFAAFAALIAIGFLDHYPWTQLQFQVAWWGCLAALLNCQIGTLAL
jgi:O-antigen ligase